MTRFMAAVRSTPARVFAAFVGLAVVGLIVRELGPKQIGAALATGASYFPIVVIVELGVLACSMQALRKLYGDAAARLPRRALLRAALIGYAVQGIVPAGRAAAEATRATLLARLVGDGRAAAAATRMQAVVLLANALVSVPGTIAAAVLGGPTWLPFAIAINAAVTAALGIMLLLIAHRGQIGAWLGRRIHRVRAFGADFDAALEEDTHLFGAVAWELAGRLLQVGQQAVLIVSVGGVLGVASAFCAEGIHLVGAAVGDLIPAQLGATEGNFTIASAALGLDGAGAVSVALLAHVAQLFWVVVGTVVPLISRPRSAEETHVREDLR